MLAEMRVLQLKKIHSTDSEPEWIPVKKSGRMVKEEEEEVGEKGQVWDQMSSRWGRND